MRIRPLSRLMENDDLVDGGACVHTHVMLSCSNLEKARVITLGQQVSRQGTAEFWPTPSYTLLDLSLATLRQCSRICSLSYAMFINLLVRFLLNPRLPVLGRTVPLVTAIPLTRPINMMTIVATVPVWSTPWNPFQTWPKSQLRSMVLLPG